MRIPVQDSFRAVDDPALPTMPALLDPIAMQAELQSLPALRPLRPRMRAIRVTRHKPGRRCVIEYEVAVGSARVAAETLTLIGKVRARHGARSACRRLAALYASGFDDRAADGLVVPEPIGAIERFGVWLQRKLAGQVLADALGTPGCSSLMRRVADIAHKVHSAGVAADRVHDIGDELAILRHRLDLLAAVRPDLAPRLAAVAVACDRVAGSIPVRRGAGIHRDFHPEQLIVCGPKLALIDFDLYCVGDPCLDIGNFVGHLTEHALRCLGDADALAECEDELVARFASLAGADAVPAIRAYAVLTLARLVQIAALFADRCAFVDSLLALVEERLAHAGAFARRISVPCGA